MFPETGQSASTGIVAWAYQPGLVGQYDGLDPIAELEFGEEPGDVGLDRRLAEGQLRRKFGVAQAAGEQPQDVEFPGGEMGQSAAHQRGL